MNDLSTTQMQFLLKLIVAVLLVSMLTNVAMAWYMTASQVKMYEQMYRTQIRLERVEQQYKVLVPLITSTNWNK